MKDEKKDYFVMHSTEQIIASSYSCFGLSYTKSFLNLFVIWHKQKIQ